MFSKENERFESYLSKDLWDCLELFICSNWTCNEYLVKMSNLEKHISIGWIPLGSSVAFSSFEKAKIAIFGHIFALKAEFKRFFAKFTKNDLQSLKSCQRHTEGGFEPLMSSVYHPLQS